MIYPYSAEQPFPVGKYARLYNDQPHEIPKLLHEYYTTHMYYINLESLATHGRVSKTNNGDKDPRTQMVPKRRSNTENRLLGVKKQLAWCTLHFCHFFSR